MHVIGSESEHAEEPLAELPPPGRATREQLVEEIRAVSESSIVQALLELVDSVMLVLNEQRQVVAFNGGPLPLTLDVLGRRPGEILGCRNALGPDGCGSSPNCRQCGSLAAVLASRRDNQIVESECLLRTDQGCGAYEFRVRAAPIKIEGHQFTVLSLRDISAEKRREALEQIFFHDIANSVSGLRGWARLLSNGANVARAGERIDLLTQQLEREVRDQRSLLAAEDGTLHPVRERVRARAVLEGLASAFSYDSSARGRRLHVATDTQLELETDPGLLHRVLANMVRNALEASSEGQAVTVRCEALDGETPAIRFEVHNETAIPPDIQGRVFVRSFSTKAARGRGLGTHSMKLLGERYLKGQVSFSSSPERGTLFWIDLPL